MTVLGLAIALLGFAPSALAKTHHATPKNQPQSRHLRQPGTKKPGVPGKNLILRKLDGELDRRASVGNPNEKSKVIVMLQPGAQLPEEFKKYMRGSTLGLLNGQPLELPNRLIRQLEKHPNFYRVVEDRPIKTHNYRTSVTVGAKTVQDFMGYTGSGIGIAVIDSGISTWHDDLTKGGVTKIFPYGNQRVSKFVDFVNGRTLPYDDNGHGTHVAGIIGGNGYDSLGEKTGIAPKASLVSLKVLDANGQGTISNIIAALGWVAANAKTYNIRVVNMSVGAPIRESYWTDPLTLATKRVTDMGITVVTAAGNMGKNAGGHLQKGGITAPANAPWVLTVGASSTMGTLTRNDDKMADFSSSGPTFKDYLAKPDVTAPGAGTISLAVPGSTFYLTKTAYLVSGKIGLGSKPYLSLSGTSMAAPVVSGTVALMLQANPNLTPNLIKAIIEYTAQQYPGYSSLRQGAGFLNTLGAVRLAQFYASHQAGNRMPVQAAWSRHILWGNHMLKGGYINPKGNAWANSVVWGAVKTADDSENIVWGTDCGDDACGNIVWGTADDDGENIVWGTSDEENIVWGTACGDDACENIVWGTDNGDENIVWGTDCGGADCENIVWGTEDPDGNIVWGTAEEGENIVWGTADADGNIVWGTSTDSDVTWGESSEDEVLYSDDDSEPLPDAAAEFGDVITTTVTDPVTGVTTITVTNQLTGETTVTVVSPPPPSPPPPPAPDPTLTTVVTDPNTGITTTTVTNLVTGAVTITTTGGGL